MRNHCALCLTALSLGAIVASAQTPWSVDLAYPGGGYWPARVSVSVTNPGAADVMGAPAQVVVGKDAGQADLAGLPAESVRVADALGQELLYEITGANGTAKHKGALETGDVITLPVEVPAGETASLYVYAGNREAWAPPDYIGGQFVNGGFEQGDGGPGGWEPWETDATHRVAWQEGGARTGDRCGRCEVETGAEPTWVKYMQTRIPVTPGTNHRFTAWVRGEDVVGSAGWYIHVDGVEPQMVNISEGWDGTFDWRQVTLDFTVPEGGQFFSCGTILRGTGTAWYDDAAFETTGGAALQVSVGEQETLELRRVTAPEDQPTGREWRWKTPVVVRNFSSEAREAVLVSVNMHRPRTILAKHAGWRYDLAVQIIDPGAPGKPRPCTWADARLLTVTDVPARSEKELTVHWSPAEKPSGASETLSLADWADSGLSLAQNGDMEAAEGQTAAAWPSGEEGREGPRRFTVRRVEGGVSGDWCLELSVPPENLDVGWVGSRQRVPVRPNTRYLLAGHIRGENLSGGARIHGHHLKADGSLSAHGPFFGTSPETSDTADWTFTSISVTTPPDGAFIDIHLTMNGTGTLWHDGVLLFEAQTGAVEGIEGEGAAEELAVWSVNPMVKVFPDDWPTAGRAPVELYACRNEYEPFKLALQAGRRGEATVRASALSGPNGARLDPPAAYRVGYVPIDFPVGYARSDQPYYFRMKPTSPGNDGWTGEWPDPLIPLDDGSVKFEAGRTQALWFDIHVPGDAPPGEYSGQVELEFAGDTHTVPVRLTVWPHVLPERKACKAIYDLRNGRGWNIFAGDDQWTMIEAWYRLLAEYNVSPGLIHPTPTFKQEGGQLAIDFAEFDRACEMLFDELNCNVAYTPWFFYSFGWAYSPKAYFGFEPFTPEWNGAFQGGLRRFFDHVGERGWRDHFVYYVSDEPDRNSERVHTDLARVCDAAREAVPDVLVYSSTWTHLPRLDDHLNLWGIGPHGSFPVEEVEQRRAAGDRFWFTTDGQMCLDTPYLAIERLLPWFCLKYGVEAYEFWGVSWWTHDPWDYGWHSYIRQSHEGEEYFWVRYPNGDGYLTYPGERLGQNEPLPSIRLAAAREGIEDYEIFIALQEHAENDDAARKALERVRELVEMPNPGGRYSTSIMPNPDAVVEARVAAGKALARAADH